MVARIIKEAVVRKNAHRARQMVGLYRDGGRLEDVGAAFNVSRERARQIIKKTTGLNAQELKPAPMTEGERTGNLILRSVITYRRGDFRCLKCEQTSVFTYTAARNRYSCGCCRKTAYIDIAGQVFGLWTALEYVGQGHWRCRCDCGTEKVVRAANLRGGYSRSCYCQGRRKKEEET